MIKVIKNIKDESHTCDMSCKFLKRIKDPSNFFYNNFSCNKTLFILENYNKDTPYSIENCKGNTNTII